MRDRNDHPLVSDYKRAPLPKVPVRTLLAVVFAVAVGLAAAVLTYGTIHASHAPHYQADDDPGLIP